MRHPGSSPPPGAVTGRRLRIGIDAHAIGERKTGNERWVSNLIPALRSLCHHELVLYFTNPEAARAWPPAAGTRTAVLRPANPLARIPVTLAYRAWRDRLDALLVQYTAPPVTSCPVVTMVHDVAFAVHPEYFRPVERLWMNRTIPFTARRAAEVLTVSEFSKQEIGRLYGLAKDRITVAHNGVDPIFLDRTPRPSPIDPPFFLAVGNLQPRKNLATLLGAFGRLAREHPEIPERLVIVGQEVFGVQELHGRAEHLRASGRVLFTGYVGDAELVGLIQRATAFAYPSVYEGFGLPPVEAMAAGTPSLVSDIPVMREVVGDAALRLPATDQAAWAEGLRRVATEPAMREDLARRGRDRAAGYTWERSAGAVLGALERAAEGRRRRPVLQ